MRAAETEIDQQLARRGEDAARRLGGDQRLEMQNVDEPGLDELRLRQRRGDAQDRFAGEKRRAFRHGVHIAGKAKRREIIEHVLSEAAGALEPCDVGRGEAQIFQIVERLLEAGGEQKSAPPRQRAHEKLEHRGLREASIQIGLDHVELVEVGE